jgi:hypothetical protein
MGHGKAQPHSSRDACTLWRLIYLVALLPITNGQSGVVDTPSSIESLTRSTTSYATSTQKSVSSNRFIPSMKTAYTSASPSNSTASSASAKPTDNAPELFPVATNTDSHQVRTNGVFNYYFLFLALFGLLTAVSLWWIHRRRKRRKEQMRLSGHDALARDMDGWINTRRWFHGTRRHNQTAAFIRREEGLNEHGEAPPPYQPKNNVPRPHAIGGSQDPVSGLVIPLRTLPRNTDEQGRPPAYRESAGRGESSTVRPDAADTDTTRPESAIT